MTKEHENEPDLRDQESNEIESISNPKKSSNKTGMYVLMGLGAFFVILILWVLFSNEESKAEEEKNTKVEEEYKVVTGQQIVIPSKQPVADEQKQPKTTVDIEPIKAIEDEKQKLPEPKKELTQEEKKAIAEKKKLLEARKRSPMVIFNKGGTNSDVKSNRNEIVYDRQKELYDKLLKSVDNQGQGGAGFGGSSPSSSDGLDSQLKATQTQPVDAKLITDRAFTVAQGKIIGATMETAISSDLPGMVRAVVSEDVYSHNGKNLLIKRQSRLVGEYRSSMKQGQSRIFILWNRIITPEGIDIAIASPSTDTIGQSGQGGEIDSHFIERFGASTMLSVIGALSTGDGSDQQRIELGENLNKSAEIALEHSINIKPTIYVNQGEPIKVFLARDINLRKAYELAN